MTHRWSGPRLALLLCCFACPGATDSTPAPITRADPAPKPEAPAEPTTPPLPPPPSMQGASAVPAVQPHESASECPPVPALAKKASAAQRARVPAISVLHDVSCRPEVFGLSIAALRETLNVPPDIEIEVGRRYARIAFAEPVSVHDALAVMGVRGAKMRLEQGWSSSWEVGTGDDAAQLRPWGPGRVTLRIPGERNDDREHGTVAEIPADAKVDAIGVVLPESAASFADDPHAAPAAVGALITIAQDPGLLRLAPEVAHARLSMLGERYQLHHYSVGMGAEERVGFSLRPHRTELGAHALAQGLGLSGAHHEAIHITDTNPNRLAQAGETDLLWRGLQLEIELDERAGGGLGLAGWTVGDILILPADP